MKTKYKRSRLIAWKSLAFSHEMQYQNATLYTYYSFSFWYVDRTKVLVLSHRPAWCGKYRSSECRPVRLQL